MLAGTHALQLGALGSYTCHLTVTHLRRHGKVWGQLTWRGEPTKRISPIEGPLKKLWVQPKTVEAWTQVVTKQMVNAAGDAPPAPAEAGS